MRECLNYPSANTFERVIGLSKRPLTKETARLPEDPKLEIHTGLDLTDAELALQRLEDIPNIADVTHVYFVAYTGHGTSPENLVEVNSAIVDNALVAVNILCPNVKFVSLQTGGKHHGYGMVGHGWPPAPWKETLPRMPEPYASKIFYYAQHDVVARHAAASSWKWAEIRPSFLPGFVPQFNAMNVAQSLGLYLSFYRSTHGDGAICPFPGSQESWVALHTDSFQDVVARFHIHVSGKAIRIWICQAQGLHIQSMHIRPISPNIPISDSRENTPTFSFFYYYYYYYYNRLINTLIQLSTMLTTLYIIL
ncbi:hypothetical protein CKAH01_15354 [Colletotrichum kahawae]|uniref:PRISE-like Rossmann-fold domain-containing protein n=1 Tax=Colletotrichum kahawae TaxID=34407 RepID=A0AAD9YGF8_COLKA|nr:hypothetical protein CKAH01_15354 [Colletotrichum kahawae]